MTDRLDGLSMDIESGNRARLKSVFPECFTEGKLDVDKLLSLCGEYITDDYEKYEFKWKGKSECLRLAQRRSTATLRPCPDESVNFDTTKNLYIEGDNLEVLKLLQKSYFRKVKMIYIDPPYNTGNDFVYEDDFKDPLARYKEVTQQTTKSNPETMGRYHTNWLNMMYPRLRLAANLLRDDGVIFISIDDNEVANLRKVCDEAFGEENFIAQITVVNNLKGRNDRKNVATCHEYLLIYGKVDFEAKGLPLTDEQRAAFDKTDENGNKYQLRDLRKRGQGDRREDRPNMYFPIYYDKSSGQCSLDFHAGWVEIYPIRGDGSDGRWRWGKERVLNNLSKLEAKQVRNSDKWGIEYRIYLNPAFNSIDEAGEQADEQEERDAKSKSFWNSPELSTDVARRQMKALFGTAVFDFPKSVDLLKKALYMGTNCDDIILDFFSGSATTAHAVMQLNAEDGGNRHFIMVQLPEVCDEKSEAYKAGYKNICEIGKERIRRAGKSLESVECGVLSVELSEGGGKNSKLHTPNSTLDVGFLESVECGVKETDSNSKLHTPNSTLKTSTLDVGFKVFKLDTSNMKLWDDTPIEGGDLETLFDRIDGHIDGLKPDRSDEDLIYEILLKMGYPLTAGLTTLDVDGLTVYKVDSGEMLICLQEGITAEHIEQMAALSPQKIVLAGRGLADSSTKANAFYLLENRGIELKTI